MNQGNSEQACNVLMQVFEMNRTTHMSEGNRIRLRINTKYNLVTPPKNIRLHPAVKTRAQTFHLHFQCSILHCYKMAWLYLEICSILGDI